MNRTSKGMDARVLSVALASILGLFMLSTGEVRAQVTDDSTGEPRTIRVSGVGEVRVQPDLATVQFGVETTGATAQEAGQANATAMDRVIRALVDSGISRENIRTSGYSLYPEYAREQPRESSEVQTPRIVGYRAMNQVAVRTTDLEGVGRLIDIGLQAGANRMNGLSFEVQDAQAAQAAALQRAVETARASAETMANALGVTLGPVLDASTGSDPVRPVYRVASEMAMDAYGAAPTPIQPGEQAVTANASLIFAIQ